MKEVISYENPNGSIVAILATINSNYKKAYCLAFRNINSPEYNTVNKGTIELVWGKEGLEESTDDIKPQLHTSIKYVMEKFNEAFADYKGRNTNK